MSYFIFNYLHTILLVITFIFSLYFCKILFFILDTIVILLAFLILFNSLDLPYLHHLDIAYYFFHIYLYIFIKFIVLLALFICKKKKLTIIDYETRGKLEKLLIFFNIVLNILSFPPQEYNIFMTNFTFYQLTMN